MQSLLRPRVVRESSSSERQSAQVPQRADSGYYGLAQQLRSVPLGVTAHQATSGDDKGDVVAHLRE